MTSAREDGHARGDDRARLNGRGHDHGRDRGHDDETYRFSCVLVRGWGIVVSRSLSLNLRPPRIEVNHLKLAFFSNQHLPMPIMADKTIKTNNDPIQTHG